MVSIQKKGDRKCYWSHKKYNVLKNQRILIKKTQIHFRQHDHIEGGKNFCPLVNVDFQLVEGNAPMKEHDPKEENTIEDVSIGVADNVPENRIKEDATSTTDEDDEDDNTSTPNDDDDNIDMCN